jgi:methionyl-tRNA formyltransferase
MRIVFMGTPDFAVASLKRITEENFNVVGVITVPDKPAGRGLELYQSPVKKYALEKNIPILQPDKLKDPAFVEQLQSLKADVFVVVAFRMLPDVIWQMPPKGTFNLHASLLPQYRGAAPINWAFMNGEKETGATTFFISHDIDTGNIIYQEKIPIGENENAGSLHDKLMVLGAGMVCKTLNAIESGNCPNIPQDKFLANNLNPAPKIFKENCKINWSQDIHEVHNFIRGLSPYPAAWSEMISPAGIKHHVKIFEALPTDSFKDAAPGTISSDGKKFFNVTIQNGSLEIKFLQLEGKKRLSVEEFLRGFQAIQEFNF